MKLCPKAVAIRSGYWESAEKQPPDSWMGLNAENDKRQMVRRLHQHMATCKLCSK